MTAPGDDPAFVDDGEAAAPALEALRSLQAPLIAAHVEHQRLMVESHVAFLRAISSPYEGIAAIAPGADAGVGLDREGTRAFWRGVTGMHRGWAGEDLLFALIDTFVGQVHVEGVETLSALRERGAIYVANHQVAVETILAALVLGGLTGRVALLPAKDEHRTTWIGELMRRLTARPGLRDPGLLRFIDRADPSSVLRLRGELAAELREGRSVVIHVEGTRAKTCRQPVLAMSSVFIDLALEVGAPVVPLRLAGGLPIDPLDERLEFPIGYGRQDYFIGRPISADELRATPFAERARRILGAINALGVTPDAESPSPPSASFAALVARHAATRPEPQAVLLAALSTLADPSDEGRRLTELALRGLDANDRAPASAWLSDLAEWLGGGRSGGGAPGSG